MLCCVWRSSLTCRDRRPRTLSHKIALEPTVKQERYFRRAAGTARFVWTWALAKWKELYERGEKPNACTLKTLWNEMKQEAYPWV